MNTAIETHTDILITYPKLIENNVRQILDKKNAISQLKENIRRVEIKTEADVSDDSKKEQWKTELSNAEKRKTEVMNRLGVNEKYLKLKETLEAEDERSVGYKEAEVSRMRREFDAALVLVPLLKSVNTE